MLNTNKKYRIGVQKAGTALFYVKFVNERVFCPSVYAGVWQTHPVRAALGRPSECEDGGGSLRGTAKRERKTPEAHP